jgi:hypothetical protein
MLGPYSVHRLHPQQLGRRGIPHGLWRDGVLSITYVRHGTPDDGPFYLAE